MLFLTQLLAVYMRWPVLLGASVQLDRALRCHDMVPAIRWEMSGAPQEQVTLVLIQPLVWAVVKL